MTRTITCPAQPTRRTTLARPPEQIRRRLRQSSGAKKAAAVSGQPLCLALSVSGTVRRTPSPQCPMVPPHCVLNNKHPCNPKPVCRGIASAFLPGAAGGRIQKAMSYSCHISGIGSASRTVICQVYIPSIYHFWPKFGTMIYTRLPDIYQTYDILCHMTGIYLVYIRYTSYIVICQVYPHYNISIGSRCNTKTSLNHLIRQP
jgi:hypothetical protein